MLLAFAILAGCAATPTPGALLDFALGIPSRSQSVTLPSSSVVSAPQTTPIPMVVSEDVAESIAAEKAVIIPTPVGPRKRCAKIIPTGNWRIHGMLWKPVAEHVGKPVVITLPRGSVSRVALLNNQFRPVRALPFRSRGDAGDAWQELELDAVGLNQLFKKSGFWVRIRFADNSCKQFFVKDAKKRSDTGRE